MSLSPLLSIDKSIFTQAIDGSYENTNDQLIDDFEFNDLKAVIDNMNIEEDFQEETTHVNTSGFDISHSDLSLYKHSSAIELKPKRKLTDCFSSLWSENLKKLKGHSSIRFLPYYSVQPKMTKRASDLLTIPDLNL